MKHSNYSISQTDLTPLEWKVWLLFAEPISRKRWVEWWQLGEPIPEVWLTRNENDAFGWEIWRTSWLMEYQRRGSLLVALGVDPMAIKWLLRRREVGAPSDEASPGDVSIP